VPLALTLLTHWAKR